MEVNLPPDLHQFISDRVHSGVFPSTDAAISRAVEALREQEAEIERRRLELYRELDLGIEQIERNEGTEVSPEGLDDFFDQIISRARQRLEQEIASETAT